MSLLGGFSPFGSFVNPLKAGLGAFRDSLIGPKIEPSQAPLAGMPKPAPAPSVPGGNEIESYIIQAAQARGIDPRVALKVARAEGGTARWNRQSDVINKKGQRERSYGPFQLYIDGGLGNRALAAGIDPRNEAQGREAIDFALDEVARAGWGQWYGAAKVGVGDWDGVRGAKALGRVATASKAAEADPYAAFADGPKGQEVYRPALPPSGGAGFGEAPAGTQTLPGSDRRSGASSGAGISLGNETAESAPPARTPVGQGFEGWKVNRTTRRLRGISPAATIGVLAAIGQDVRALRGDKS